MCALHTFLRRFPLFVVSLVLMWVLALPVLAQNAAPTPTPTPSGPVTLKLDSPFAQTRQPLSIVAQIGKWFPVAVTLANTGDEVLAEVRLRLVASGSFDYVPNDFYTPVVLPPNSRKVVWLYGRLERSNVDAIEVTLSGRGVGTLKATAQITIPDEHQRVMLVVSDGSDGTAEMLRGLRNKELYRRKPQNGLGRNVPPIRAIEASRELVPDRWVGLEGADGVVLSDFPHVALTPLQLDALRGYAVGGGNMVVTGGTNAARLSGSPLRDLWPLQAQRSIVASTEQVAGLVEQYVPKVQNAGDRLGGAPVALVQGQLTAGAVVADGSQAQPLFAWRNSGAGRTLMLAYDPAQPPFKGWSGQGMLWSDLFKSFARTPELTIVGSEALYSLSSGVNPSYSSSYYEYENTSNQTLTEKLLSTLSRAKQLRLPPVSQIAWFLALYVFFLVPVNYAVLRFFDRRELAWITIPLIVIIFSVWAYSAALSIRGRAILTRQIDVVQSAAGSTQGRVDSLFWLFSPNNTRYDLTSSGQNAVVADFFTEDAGSLGPFSLLQPEDGSGFKAEGALLRQWSARSFISQSLVDMKKGVSLNGTVVRNDSPFDLQGAVWVQDKQVLGLGELKAGSSLDLTKATPRMRPTQLSNAIVQASQLDRFFDASMRSNGVAGQALEVALSGYETTPQRPALLIGWANRTVSPIKIDQARGTDVSLFVWRFAQPSPKLPSSR